MSEKKPGYNPEAENNPEKRDIASEEKFSEPRTTLDVSNDIRDHYFEMLKNQNLAHEVVSEMVNDLESSSSWPEFARKQNINRLRIQAGSFSEKIMNLVKEYYKVKEKEDKNE